MADPVEDGDVAATPAVTPRVRIGLRTNAAGRPAPGDRAPARRAGLRASTTRGLRANLGGRGLLANLGTRTPDATAGGSAARTPDANAAAVDGNHAPDDPAAEG